MGESGTRSRRLQFSLGQQPGRLVEKTRPHADRSGRLVSNRREPVWRFRLVGQCAGMVPRLVCGSSVSTGQGEGIRLFARLERAEKSFAGKSPRRERERPALGGLAPVRCVDAPNRPNDRIPLRLARQSPARRADEHALNRLVSTLPWPVGRVADLQLVAQHRSVAEVRKRWNSSGPILEFRV